VEPIGKSTFLLVFKKESSTQSFGLIKKLKNGARDGWLKRFLTANIEQPTTVTLNTEKSYNKFALVAFH